MYKELLITIIIIVTILGLDIITNRYNNKVTENLSNNLEILKNDIKNKNSYNIEEQLDLIFNDWEEYYNVLAYYIEHDELEKVETELTRLKSYYDSKMYDECINEIDTTVFILRHIKDKEKFTFQSIF